MLDDVGSVLEHFTASKVNYFADSVGSEDVFEFEIAVDDLEAEELLLIRG